MTTIPSRSESATSRTLERLAHKAHQHARLTARYAAFYARNGDQAKAARWKNVNAIATFKAKSLEEATAAFERRVYVNHPPKGIPWDAISFLLGWYPDRYVATALGVVHSTVIWARRQRGWPAAHKRGRPSRWRDFEPFPGPHPRGWIPDLADPFQRAYATADDGEGLAAVGEEVREHLQRARELLENIE